MIAGQCHLRGRRTEFSQLSLVYERLERMQFCVTFIYYRGAEEIKEANK